MNNVLMDAVPYLIKQVWDYYSIPRREHLLHIPKEINAEVAFGITCRMLTEEIDRYIIAHPQQAIEKRIVVWFGELLCYKKSGEFNTEHDIYVSCHGRAYQLQDDGSLKEMYHEIVKHGSNSYYRYPLPWAKEPLQDMSERKRDYYSLAPHRIVCYFPGNPMPKMWSKLFDTLRNGIPQGMTKSGGDYYVRVNGQLVKDKMEVTKTKGGKVLPTYPGDKGQDEHNHVADHVFNDTAQEPGVHMWFDCRLVLPDINTVNVHTSTNDKDCVTWPLQAGFAQKVQYQPWCYVEYTQFATHDPFHFDRTGDRAVRYYQQMIQQYFNAIDKGCTPVDFDKYDWCEAMK
ncbi:TPA: hypothetical protein IG063_004767, partial [Escherichia coli]|nr:hypothetical protein [Escherichia coli]